MTLSRRSFLANATLLPLGSTIFASAEPIKRRGGPLLKTSLNAFSFGKLLNEHMLGRGAGMSLFDFMEFAAKQNFDGVDLTGYYFPGYRDRVVPEDKLVFDLKRRAFELGLGISGTGVGNNFTTADKEARAKDVTWIKQWVEVAAKLGAPVLRVFADTLLFACTLGWEGVAGGMGPTIRVQNRCHGGTGGPQRRPR